MKRDGALTSLWQNKMPDYISQTSIVPKERYDVVIVGGGITGITTALLLQKAGKRCLLAEAQTIGFGTSGGTTAHLNTMMDTPYNTLAKNFGEENARKVASLAKRSIDLIKDHIREYNIQCDFSDRTGYLFSQDDKQNKELKEIFEASAKAGCNVAYSDTIPVPINFTQ